MPVLIDNIFYDFDKYTLRDESVKALDDLVKLLNENPNVTIELSAHCDYKGSAAYNQVLSQRRAEAVVNYLIAHGVAKDRLTPKGYGKDKPKTIRKKLTSVYSLVSLTVCGVWLQVAPLRAKLWQDAGWKQALNHLLHPCSSLQSSPPIHVFESPNSTTCGCTVLAVATTSIT